MTSRTNNNQTFSTLELNGGRNAFCAEIGGRRPDLLVWGGMLVKQDTCLEGDINIGGNLHVTGSTLLNNLIVAGDLYGNLIAQSVMTNELIAQSVMTDELIVNDSAMIKDLIVEDVCVSGNLIVQNGSVVLLQTYAGNTAVWIEPATGLLPMTILVDKLPCNGVIATVDSLNGNILYVPIDSTPAPEIDVFMYHGLNAKGYTTNVTQFICTQQIQLVPPFLQNICLNRAPLSNFVDTLSTIGSYSQTYGSITGSSIQGTFPINWSTLTISSITSYTQNKSGVKNCMQWLLVPPVFGTNTSTALTGPGIPISGSAIQYTSVLGATFTFTVVHDNAGNISLNYVISGSNGFFDSDFVISVGAQVSDIYGNPSNLATIFIEESSHAIFFTPSSGPIGSILTVTGTADFTTTTAFSVNGFPGLVISSTPTSMIGFVMPGTTNGPISVTTVSNGTLSSSSSFTITPTLTPIMQQGPKLIGTGATPVSQGIAIALSADGNTLASGGNSYYTVVPSGIWIFTRTAGVWSQEGTKLLAVGEIGNAHLTNDNGGIAISADGNTVVAGGPTDNSNQGAVWVFTRTSGVWSFQTKIVATGNIGPAGVGGSVHVSADGNTIVAAGTGDNGGVGAAWIFVRNAGVWSQQAKLVGSGTIGTSRQGWGCAISSDGNTVGLGGDLDNNIVGAIWIFTRSGVTWTQQAKLVGTGYTGQPRFGNCAFSANGNIVAIAGFTDGGNGSFGTGAVWIFDRVGTTWTQRGSKYITVGSDSNSQCGISPGALSADGNTLLVSGWRDNGVGAQWVLSRNGSTWNSVIKIANPEPGSDYGNAHGYLSSNSTTMAVGSRNSPSNSGIGGVFIYV